MVFTYEADDIKSCVDRIHIQIGSTAAHTDSVDAVSNALPERPHPHLPSN